MPLSKLNAEIFEALQSVPILDGHSHLTNGKLGARGLHDILLYHMVVSDLYAAGCPSGARLTEFPHWPSKEEAHTRLREALPYLKYIQNTNCFWGVRIILRELYGWHQPITAGNWEELDARIRERAADRPWQRSILRKANIKKVVTEYARRETGGGAGADDDIMQYSMEWAFFTRTQKGENDTAVYELERCWGLPPGSPIPHAAKARPPAQKTIRTVEDVQAALRHFVDEVTKAPVLSYATHVSSQLNLRRVSEAEMSRALARRATAGVEERDIYASYINEALLEALAARAPKVVFQFSLAAEPLPHETGSLIPQRALAALAEIISRHNNVKFVCFVASLHANQALCTFCRELPNFALAGYWWHNFFPATIRQLIHERLDMLPVNKQLGFFSDAYALEWAYAKSVIVRKQLAEVLAAKVAQGQYSQNEALAIARAIFYETPQTLLGMTAPAE